MDATTRTTQGPRVGLFGLLGSGNLGNDVSMESVLTYLRAAHPDAVVDAMCKGPDTVAARYGIPGTWMNWYQRYESSATGTRAVALKLAGKVIDVFRIAAWVRRHDVVIVPGMGVLEASLPLKAWQLPYSLYLLSWWGRLLGARVAFVGVGAGTIRKRATRVLLDGAAERAFYRSYRDAGSRDAMRERGIDTSADHVYADVAFGLPAPEYGPGDPRVVGVGVMAYQGGADDRGRRATISAGYAAAMVDFIGWLLDQGREARLLVGDENASERAVAEEILAAVRAARPHSPDSALVLCCASTYQELMAQMAPAATVVATRFHSMICALRLGRPVLAIGYAPKFAEVLTTMGLAELQLSARSPSGDLIVSRFTGLERRRDELERAVAAGNAIYEKRAADQFAELSEVVLGAKAGFSIANR